MNLPLPLIIGAIMVGLPTLCGVVAWRSCAFYDRWISEQTRADCRRLTAREQAVRDSVTAHAQRMAVREHSVHLQRAAAHRGELHLGQQAHDTCTMINATMHRIEDDTEIDVMNWDKP